MLINNNAKKVNAHPKTDFLVIPSLKNTADISIEKTKFPPCINGYNCEAVSVCAAAVVNREFKNKHTAIKNTYTLSLNNGILFFSSPVCLFALVIYNKLQKINRATDEKTYV